MGGAKLLYAFSIGFPWLQELYVWQHAAVFMAGAGYTMLHRGHVNVDVLYGQLNERRRAWVDILGTIFFLFPWLAILAGGDFIKTSTGKVQKFLLREQARALAERLAVA